MRPRAVAALHVELARQLPVVAGVDHRKLQLLVLRELLRELRKVLLLLSAPPRMYRACVRVCACVRARVRACVTAWVHVCA